MSKTPLISVVLPSYNHVDFVTTAVESVLDQNIKNLELIVVDDGSTDGTPEQVERIKDPRIQLIKLEQNRLRHPRNLALSLVKGHYIAFQNSDDLWLADKLPAQINILEQQKDVVVCFTDVELIDDHNEVVRSSWANGLFKVENRSRFAWLRHFFTHGNCLCISSAVVRTEAIKEVGMFRGSLIQLSDFDLWVRLAAIGDFHIINEKLTRFRIVGGKKENKVDAEVPVYRSRINLSGPIPHLAGRILPAPLKALIKKVIGTTAITSSDNLSAPKASSVYRSFLEFADVLGNYANPPILDLIPRVFKEVMPDLKDSTCIRQAWLAKYAWTFHSAPHALFADRLITTIMENETVRNEVIDVFGAEIVREYVRRRGQLSFRIEDVE
jgi:glycosyltransferase involved in cell wall biosynthesis